MTGLVQRINGRMLALSKPLPWLEHGWTFLTGLPEPVRRRRVLMPIQAYIDESEDGGWLVLAGWIATAESWLSFSDEWQECLNKAPSISYFKMREAASREECFRGMRPEFRDMKLRQLAGVIRRYEPVPIHCSINLEAWASTLAAPKRRPISDPYFWPFQWLTYGVLSHLTGLGILERFEMFFDENGVYGRKAREWYPVIRGDFLRSADPLARMQLDLLPVEPLFKTDTEFLPLQAADMLAWLIRRDIGEASSPFDWLLPEVLAVPMSAHSWIFDQELLEYFQAESERRRLEYGEEAATERWAEFIDPLSSSARARLPWLSPDDDEH